MTNQTLKLSVNRLGTFTVEPSQFCDTQCGAQEKKTYSYEVSIEGSNKHLDEKGFLIDNLWIADYFNGKYEVGNCMCPSCEIIASEAIEYFLTFIDTFKKEGITKITVKISGSEMSFIVAEWNWKLKSILFGKLI